MVIPWADFKNKLIGLPKSGDPIIVRQGDVIVDEELFVKSHIATIDAFPRKENLTIREKNARLNICKPHYDRLMAYYLMKTELQGVF